MREFNITGNCNLREHYMVDISNKLEKISELVNKGKYFTINRARQYGKTTTVRFLHEKIKGEYIVLRTTFEGLSDIVFKSDKNFNENFIDTIAELLEREKVPDKVILDWKTNEPVKTIKLLGDKITKLCSDINKKIVLIIDEVDKSCNHKLFLDFLGMLRAKFLERDETPTFHSVILVGVHDIKNIRYSGSNQNSRNNDLSDNTRKQDSPWNIATKFEIDMSFNPDEIATMLNEYEKDYKTGMNILAVSNEIYHFTSGYPFLVSRICKEIDEKLSRNWTLKGVQDAVKVILSEENTLFDDMFKNFENNKELYDLVYDVLVVGLERNFGIDIPEIKLGATYGILVERDGKIAIANKIFESRIYNYFVLKDETKGSIPNVLRSDVVLNGKFDMKLTLKKFAEHYVSIFNEKDKKFLERHCRLIFLTYLKPLINGAGFYHIESETLDARRMDVILDYGDEQFIIELKLWYGENYLQKAYSQLWEYLHRNNAKKGYLITFDFRESKQPKFEWIEFEGKRILDVVI